MKISSFAIALFTLAFGANAASPAANPGLAHAESLVDSSDLVLQILNRELQKAANENQVTPELVASYMIDLYSQSNEVLSELIASTSGYTPDVAKSISAVVIKPFYDEVVKGAQSLSAVIDKTTGPLESDVSAGILVNYQRLSDFASLNGIDSSALDSLTKSINEHLNHPSVSKRATNHDLSGVVGSVNNFQETLNTFMHEVTHDKGHTATAAITAIITGLDGQIDNMAASVFNVLDAATFGLTSPIGDFLLGPIFQGMTNGAQVLISNIIGGAIDMIADGPAADFNTALDKLVKLGTKANVDSRNVAMLSDVRKQWISLTQIMQSNNTAAPTAKVTSAEIEHAYKTK